MLEAVRFDDASLVVSYRLVSRRSVPTVWHGLERTGKAGPPRLRRIHLLGHAPSTGYPLGERHEVGTDLAPVTVRYRFSHLCFFSLFFFTHSYVVPQTMHVAHIVTILSNLKTATKLSVYTVAIFDQKFISNSILHSATGGAGILVYIILCKYQGFSLHGRGHAWSYRHVLSLR